MKTKNKGIALLEIAIVLCSVFLVAPAIATDQNQAMQKVSASEVTTASEDDYVLDIYGNANEDDTIDMRDLTYVKLIFFGKKPETELADAKYDGKINPLDFIQIKLIIVGKEKELTLLDSVDRIVTVKKPMERIVVSSRNIIETMRSIKAADKIVGVSDAVIKDKLFFPEFSKLPTVGTGWTLDYEAVLSLNPDLVCTYTDKAAEQAEKLSGIPVVGANCYMIDSYIEEVKKLGYIFGKKEETKEFLNFYQEHMNTIKEQVEGISEEDRPKVYHESSKRYASVPGKGTGTHQMIVIAGGNNIFSDLTGYMNVDPEEVIERNPDIIIRKLWGYTGNYLLDVEDTAALKVLWEDAMNRPELQNVAAVKSSSIYVYTTDVYRGGRHLIGTAYFAKWFHPSLFKDLDPKAMHQEYITRFQGLDFDLDKQGVFVYPPLPS